MKARWWSVLALAAMPFVALAQSPQTKPKPAASGAASAGSAAPSAKSAKPSEPPDAKLPPGHPSVAPVPGGADPEDGEPGALPPGHPSVAPDDEDGPPTGAGDGVPDGKRVPRDSAADDPTLPAGSVAVTIKDVDERPMAHTPVVLTILRSSVNKGDSTDRRTVETDGAGIARFDDLSHAGGTTFRLSTSRGAASFGLPAFALGEKVGKRALLHTFESSTVLDNKMLVFMRAVVAVSLLEDAIKVEQLISVTNLGRVAWIADLPFSLPEGFKAFDKQDTGDDARVEEVPKGAALRGTFPPGQREIVFQYHVPLSGDASQALRIRLPERVSEARVLAESSKTMGLEVRGFPPAQRVTARDGKHLLLTDRQARTPGEASLFEITISGLPTPGPGKTIALVLAALALLGGVAYAVSSSRSGSVDPEARRDLAEAREALLAELVVLERARKTGEVGPKTYERLRSSLLDALARIVGMIEQAASVEAGQAASKKARKPTRREELT